MSTTPMLRIILVRHGETIANREFRYIGSGYDNDLSAKGYQQAEQLAEALSILPVTAVYSSPLLRAYHTALPIATRHQQTAQQLADLRELHFGAWEGLTRAEVIARSPQGEQQVLAWEHDPAFVLPDGESIAQVQVRVHTLVERLAQQHPGQTIVLVSHVVPIKVLLCTVLQASLTVASAIFLDPATISVVDWRQPHPLVRLFNSHAHLGWDQARWMHS